MAELCAELCVYLFWGCYYFMYMFTVPDIFLASGTNVSGAIGGVTSVLIGIVLISAQYVCCFFLLYGKRKICNIFVVIVTYVLMTAIPVWHVINFAMLVEGSGYDTPMDQPSNTTTERESTTDSTSTSTYKNASISFGISIVILVVNTIVFAFMFLVACGFSPDELQDAYEEDEKYPKGLQKKYLQENQKQAASQQATPSEQDNKFVTLNMTENEGDLYHYTDTESANAIIESGKIEASISGSGDAAMESGVYLTPLPPWKGADLILKNNFGTISGKKDRVQSVFKISGNELPGCQKTTENCQVVLYPESVDLQKVNYGFMMI